MLCHWYELEKLKLEGVQCCRASPISIFRGHAWPSKHCLPQDYCSDLHWLCVASKEQLDSWLLER